MTPAPQQPEASAQPVWFVQAAGRVWGPYSPARVARFVAEGRVTAESLLAPEAEGPFHPAARWRGLVDLFQAPKPYRHQPAPIAGSEPASAFAAPAQLEPSQPSASTAPRRPLLVWADLASLRADQFEALISCYGAVVAIRPGLWLVQAPLPASALRNALSHRLTGADALMILHAPLAQAAWFNLDSAAERRLRQVWGGEA
jgi:hypothetical protein